VAIAELVFLRGEQILLHVRLDRAEICIGSNPTNDVVVPDPTIPPIAALLIDRGAQRYRLRDLTKGQIKIKGEAGDADEVDLEDGDQFDIGPYTLRLQLREEDPAVRQQLVRTAILGQEDRSTGEAIVIYQGASRTVDPKRPFNIGGSEDNDLVIEDGFVSSFHCRISHKNGRWFVADLESTNGTEVNGLKVRESELPIPATIRLGQAVLKFDVPSKSQDTNPQTPIARDRQAARSSFHGMIGEASSMKRVFDLVSRLSNAREPVLIMGESGSGKELVAQALHERSARKNKPYLALNCGALSSGLIEGELFGYMKGSFTGAAGDKMGAFEATDGGTLFLDEIGELPLELQPKLLRVLESSCVRRIGGTREVPIDTRVIAATHRNLEDLVAINEFREDLFHRLFVLSISIPPLRDRVEDVLPLVRHFLASQAPERKLKLDKSAEAALASYSWPGNIRELRNVIVRAILMTDGEVIREDDLSFSKDAFSKSNKDARGAVRQLESDEREKMIRVLEETDGNRSEAARVLGLSKSTFHDRLKRYGIPLKK
jgi:DNA-binding NtrC family response regulator